MYNRFNEAAHPRELVEEKVSCVSQQNVCLDSHISYLTKVYIAWISLQYIYSVKSLCTGTSVSLASF